MLWMELVVWWTLFFVFFQSPKMDALMDMEQVRPSKTKKTFVKPKVHWIDHASKYIFPISYGLFFSIYWIHYKQISNWNTKTMLWVHHVLDDITARIVVIPCFRLFFYERNTILRHVANIPAHVQLVMIVKIMTENTNINNPCGNNNTTLCACTMN